MVMCKESSKLSKLSTKLSTIWQINDYLSKKIDNRLIVDIIDTRGHPGLVVLASHSPQLFLPPGIALSTHLPLEHHRLAAGAGQKEVLLGLVLRQRRAVARGSQLRRPIAPLFYPYQVSCSPDVVFSLLHSPPPMTWCKDKMNHD